MYPYIYYEKGDVNEWASNEPLSYLLGFITGLINYKYTYGSDDLPEYEDMREMLENDGFIFKAEYNAVRAYLERIKATQAKDDDFFRELL